MVYKNSVELAGVIGNYRIDHYDKATCARFSLATDRVAVVDGHKVVVTDWHNVVAWESPEMIVTGFKKGANVKVTGRIQYRQYHAEDGLPHQVTEIIADSLSHYK